MDKPVDKLTSNDPLAWWRRGDQQILLADAIDATHDSSITVGFARYGQGETNDWTVNYDEALIITKGRFSVRSSSGTVTATPGEVIMLRTGTAVEYVAEEESELVFVTHPHWMAATTNSSQAAKLTEFHQVA